MSRQLRVMWVVTPTLRTGFCMQWKQGRKAHLTHVPKFWHGCVSVHRRPPETRSSKILALQVVRNLAPSTSDPIDCAAARRCNAACRLASRLSHCCGVGVPPKPRIMHAIHETECKRYHIAIIELSKQSSKLDMQCHKRRARGAEDNNSRFPYQAACTVSQRVRKQQGGCHPTRSNVNTQSHSASMDSHARLPKMA